MKRLLGVVMVLCFGSLSCMSVGQEQIGNLFPTVRILKLNEETRELIPVWQSIPKLWYFDSNSKCESMPIHKFILYFLDDALEFVKIKGAVKHRTSEGYFTLRVPCAIGAFELGLKNISLRINLSDIINAKSGSSYKCFLTGIDVCNKINVLNLNYLGSTIEMIFKDDGSFVIYNLE